MTQLDQVRYQLALLRYQSHEACADYRPYKGGPECSGCGAREWAHATRQCVERIAVALEPPQS